MHSRFFLVSVFVPLFSVIASAATTTWDGKHDTSNIHVTMVYFRPVDRDELPDWRERVDYYARRIEQFHQREFGQQSKLTVTVHPKAFVSSLTTPQLRQGDANRIFFRTLSEVDRELAFGNGETDAFPILLVLSEINWRPLDDFYRLRMRDDQLEFEGNYSRGEHFPGATSGGARATYLADRGVGWGLVSADGWRVPYRGSDCVIYHEGCGHTVGLPHPEPGNGSVMSQGQYRGWLSESWLDRDQKARMGWEPEGANASSDQIELFSKFRALPEPRVPQPGQSVRLKLDWPDQSRVKKLHVRYQTSIGGPWVEVPQKLGQELPGEVKLATFDRPTPVSYRVDAELHNGATTELWGYFQVRQTSGAPPRPFTRSADLLDASPGSGGSALPSVESADPIDLLRRIDTQNAWAVGDWSKEDGLLVSPKRYGARIELPGEPPEEYRLSLIVEPLDPPNGLILGQRSGGNRFVSLFHYQAGGRALSAIENIDGRNVGNESTFEGPLFQKNRMAQVIVTVLKSRVQMMVDGHVIADWQGDSERLSLSDYWKTPNENALFLGAYDCRYRFHQMLLTPIKKAGTF